jgi:hypothetical protein
MGCLGAGSGPALGHVLLRAVPFDDRVVQHLLCKSDHELAFSPRGGSIVRARDLAPWDGGFLLGLAHETPVAETRCGDPGATSGRSSGSLCAAAHAAGE